MAFLFVLIAAEALLILLTAPLGVQVRAHFCLNRKCAFAQVTFAGLAVVKIKLEIKKDRIRMSINGKNAFKKKSADASFGALSAVLKTVSEQKLVKRSSLSVAVGGEDCFGGAVGSGALGAAFLMLPPSVRYGVYWDREKERFDVEIALRLRISLLQTLFVAFILLKKGE